MRKLKFAICDQEAVYACNLMEYMTQRRNVPFEIQVFSELGSLMESLKEEETELLLISSGMMCPKIEELKIGKIVILSDGEMERELLRFPVVYKYQPSEQLTAELLDYYAKAAAPRTTLQGKKHGKILGVYAPIGRCGKTCFALTLGQILAEKESVLYLNLEEYSGFEALFGKDCTADILDVMYFIRQKKENAMIKMSSVVQRIGKLDILPPALSAEDLREVRIEEWLELLEAVMSQGGYETVILDLGSPVEDPLMLLEQCDKVYTPVIQGVMAKAKIAHYEKQLRETEQEEILKKTKYLNLPFTEPRDTGEYYLEQMVSGEMGDFVRMLLADEVTA